MTKMMDDEMLPLGDLPDPGHHCGGSRPNELRGCTVVQCTCPKLFKYFAMLVDLGANGDNLVALLCAFAIQDGIAVQADVQNEKRPEQHNQIRIIHRHDSDHEFRLCHQSQQ